MSRRINWSRGMRLTDDILRLSDKCTTQQIATALTLGAGGRFGLFPAHRPFQLSVDVNRNILEVNSLSCLAVTRNGSLIDVEYDSRYSSGFETRVILPADPEVKSLFLTVNATDDPWRDTNDGQCEPVYRFALITEGTRLPDDALPIARMVRTEATWVTDEKNFVPPCLYVSSSPRFVEVADKFAELMRHLYKLLPQRFITRHNDALKVLLPQVLQLMIIMDKERESMTPVQLLGYLQRFVGSFACACMVDDVIEMTSPEQYHEFVQHPYNYKNVYPRLVEGLELSMAIAAKIYKFEPQAEVEAPRPQVAAPMIDSTQLHQSVVGNDVSVRISNVIPGSKVLYSIDGTEPSQLLVRDRIKLDPKFNNRREDEPARNYTITLRAEVNGEVSPVATYNVTIEKNTLRWSGKVI